MYVSFCASGKPRFSEGFVVEFRRASGDTWVGNFEKGITPFSTALLHPDAWHVVVISGGQGYVVDPEVQTLRGTIGGQVEGVLESLDPHLLILWTPFDLEAFGRIGRLWKTRRLALDGIRAVRVQGKMVLGEATDCYDKWVPFEVDLATGRVTGGFGGFK